MLEHLGPVKMVHFGPVAPAFRVFNYEHLNTAEKKQFYGVKIHSFSLI